MHEILTLQLGQQSNYLATHFWNTQESYFTYGGQDESPVEHDIHFRPGIGADGSETYTPRTVIYDLKGGFGSLRKINALYAAEEDPISQGLWNGPTVPHRQTPIPPSTYQQHLDAGLDPPPLTTSSVRYWSDYNRVFYHPKSIVQIAEYELQSQLVPFEQWDVGEELFINLDREHDLLDRDLRPFAEECDQLQGLQVIAGVDDAWGGFATRYLERMRDEFGKASIWVWGLVEGNEAAREKQLQRLVNSAKSMQQITALASVYVPMTSIPSPLPSYAKMDNSSLWHTSALQATALESMTLPARLRTVAEARTTFAGLEAAFTNHGNRKIASLGMSVANPDQLKERMRTDDEETLDISLLPSSPQGPQRLGSKAHLFGSAEALRGPWESDEDVKGANLESKGRFHIGPTIRKCQTAQLFPQLSSFPPIFVTLSPESGATLLAVRTSLSTSSVVSDRIRAMSDTARRFVGLAEREALCNGLEEICDEYFEGWESESDENDDEA
ncbi:MAG: mtDNA inheritance, partitioning of the mitochondrial organelle [Bathelium mastoideum]|nr:MAG: mtDNA inheritance, partitioning of the mitochondrial organelle [Bathelium mastoideum]